MVEAVELVPMAVTDLVRDTVRVRAYVRGGPSAVALDVRDSFDDAALAPTGETASVATAAGVRRVEIWEARIAAAELARGFEPGVGAHFVGRLEARNGVDATSVAVSVPFADGLAEVPVEPLLPGMQVSEHVVNLRFDPGTVLRAHAHLDALPDAARALATLGASPDFLAVTGPVWKVADPGRAFYHGVRNDTRGIGRPLEDLSDRPDVGFDPLAAHPSVDGIYVIRDPALLDLASPNAVHEIGHRFIAFLEEVYGDPGGFHWPVSDLAVGVMGYQLGTTSERFAFRIVEHAEGGFVYEPAPVERRFNSMELYLMGLLPPAAVDSFRIFDVPDPTGIPPPGAGVRVDLPVRQIAAGTVVAAVGPREPSWPDAPTAFRVVVFVLSRGRLLTPAEMAYFDMAAARGEASEALPPLEVVVSEPLVDVLPFHAATSGLGSLSTRIRN